MNVFKIAWVPIYLLGAFFHFAFYQETFICSFFAILPPFIITLVCVSFIYLALKKSGAECLRRWHHILSITTALMMVWILTAFLVSVYFENQSYVKAQNQTKSTLVSNENVEPPGNYHQKIMDSVPIDPQSAKSWYLLGLAYDISGQSAKAIESYQEALRIDPESAESWYLLGLAYADLGQYAKAIESSQQALRIDPEDYRAWYSLGFAYHSSGQRSKVIEIYQRLKGLDANLADEFFTNYCDAVIV